MFEIGNEDKILTRGLYQVFSIQPAITCSKITIKTLEQGVKYVQS